MARGARAALAFCGLAAVASSALAAEVNLYTSREPKLIQPVLDAFAKETGIQVRSIFIANGLEERIKAEGATSPADVILLVDAARLVDVARTGLTRPLVSALAKEKVPAQLRDAGDQWTALTLRSRIVYASKERVKIDAIAYEDLADPAWKGKICIRSGQHPYNVSLFAAVFARLGEEKTADWLTDVKANLARKPSGGDREVAKDILAGTCDIGVANTYYLGLMRASADQRAWGEAVKPLKTTFRGGGTHVNISGAAVAKHAPNAANAVKLIEFMLGPTAQKLFADANFEYPVVAGVAATETEKLFGPITPDSVTLEEIAAKRAIASEFVDRAGFDR
jgi:iron(III) transport system substrate-binding protein